MRSFRLAPTLLATALVLSACGGEAPGPSAAEGAPAADPAHSGYPLAIDNCGTDVEVAQPPQRIVTIKSSATEMVLSLGLGERLVGTAFADSPLPESLAAAAPDVPELSDGAPSQEAVLELEPDLVYAGWESAFSADGAGEREALHSFGVGSYVSPAACQGSDYKPEKLDFEAVFDDIREAGEIFDAQPAAEELVAQQQQVLDSVEPVAGAPAALWYSSGTDTPFVGGGTGAPAMIMEQLGMENIAADVEDTWTSLSWEVIAERDPEVIILIDAEWNTAEDKIARLESSPVTSELSAVRTGSYLRLPFAASEAGVRNAEAVAELAGQLEAQRG